MGQFAEAKNKLLIVCEEGEEEYDEKMLKDNGVSMVVLEKEDLTEEKLKELDKQYDPWIVIVEYNGMWDPALLMGLQSRLAGRFTSPLHWWMQKPSVYSGQIWNPSWLKWLKM